jgi:hypothetical protein
VIAAPSFFCANLLFVRVFPFLQLPMKGPGKGNQDEEGYEKAMLHPSQYSEQQVFGRMWTFHI